MEEKEIYYEMLWDCTQCDAKGLLGDSHRHCPSCGAAQDPTRRYFPQPGEEVEARNHRYVGADWSCAYCSSPNSAAAAHCTNCGAGQDGTKPVATVVDSASIPVVPPQRAAPGVPGVHWMRWAFALMALALVTIGILFSTTKESTATVAQRSWAREIQIERMASVADSAWCESVPADAYSITRSKEQRSTRKVEDGQDCHDERTDKGDGTFVKKKVCTPRYRSEPVYAERCHFQVKRWQSLRTVKAGAQDASAPVWPHVGRLNNHGGATAGLGSGGSMASMASIGAEREGARHESYVLTLASGGKTWTCSVAEPVWTKYALGSSTPIQVRMTGGVDCASLK